MQRDRQIYEFGDFQLNPSESLLLLKGTPVSLPNRAFEMLLVLVQRNGHLVEKSELVSLIWEGSFVEEGNVAGIISILRKTLGDDQAGQKYIQTVPKRGYRFVGKIRTAKNETVERLQTPAESDSRNLQEEKSYPDLANRFTWGNSGLMGVGVAVALLLGLAILALITINRVSASNPYTKAQVSFSGRVNSQMPSPEVRELYMEGRHFSSRGTQEGILESIDYFHRAILRDPKYADAYAGMADSYSMLMTYEMEPIQDEYPVAKESALRALQLDDSLAESHLSMALVAFKYEWDWSKAEVEFRRAIELDPKYTSTYVVYAGCLAAQGRFDEALTEAKQAETLDPLSVGASTMIGRIDYLNRHYAEAIAVLHHAVDLDPYFARTRIRLSAAYVAVGDYSDAFQELQQAHHLSPSDPYWDGLSGYVEARTGEEDLARKRLGALLQNSQDHYIPAFSIALIYIGLRDHNQAMNWLEKAYRDHTEFLIYALSDPLFDSERSNPRFATLLAGMKLSQTNPEPGRSAPVDSYSSDSSVSSLIR